MKGKKNHKLISTDAEKALDRIKYPFMTKTLSKREIQEPPQLTANITCNSVKSECSKKKRVNALSPKIGKNGKMLALNTSIQHCTY